MTKYEILLLRTDNTNELYRIEDDATPVPPDSGDDWTLPDGQVITDLGSIACLEVGPPLSNVQDVRPWYVWDVICDFAGAAEDRDYRMLGEAVVTPTIPGAGTWWATKCSRGDKDACNRKCDLYLRRDNLLAITPGGSSTTCQ